LKTNGQSIVGDGANREVNDFYPTPPYITKALLDRELFQGNIWEPACGDGYMSEVLLAHYQYEIENYSIVFSSDLYDRGYGYTGVDFKKTELGYYIDVVNVITNPPFVLAQEFAEHALEIVPVGGKVALLLKLAFLEGVRRKAFLEKSGLRRVYVFSKRIRFDANKVTEKTSGGMIAYAWFVFEKGYAGKAEIEWL
jgi:hypothetical protein